jgi:hypothetical protein
MYLGYHISILIGLVFEPPVQEADGRLSGWPTIVSSNSVHMGQVSVGVSICIRFASSRGDLKAIFIFTPGPIQDSCGLFNCPATARCPLFGV